MPFCFYSIVMIGVVKYLGRSFKLQHLGFFPRQFRYFFQQLQYFLQQLQYFSQQLDVFTITVMFFGLFAFATINFHHICMQISVIIAISMWLLRLFVISLDHSHSNHEEFGMKHLFHTCIEKNSGSLIIIWANSNVRLFNKKP